MEFSLNICIFAPSKINNVEIFAYIEEADKPCVIAIDEFQQIGEYAEKNVEALLRTKIQRCHRAQFIFAGSNLSSASSVQAAVKLLIKNDLLTQTEFDYRVYDFFLSAWLATVY